MRRCGAPALALYLFLVTVADADGLSWYSDEALCGQLSWTASQLHASRTELVQAGLIAYRRPLYQVLDPSPMPPVRPRPSGSGVGEAVSMGEVLTHILGGVQ